MTRGECTSVTPLRELDAGGTVPPVGQQAQLEQPVRKRHGRDLSDLLCLQDPRGRGVTQPLGEHAGAWHREGGSEPVGLGLGGRAVRHEVFSMQDEMTEFVGGVESSAK
jgi:hypothetical protein